MLAATRVWIPVAIAVAGVVLMVIGHGRTAAAGAGVGLVIVALIVWMVNWMYRLSVESNRDREREEEAREYYERARTVARMSDARPRIMGVVNVTPDSFSDGGRYLDAGAAIAHGLAARGRGRGDP